MKVYKVQSTNRFGWVTLALVAANDQTSARSAAGSSDRDFADGKITVEEMEGLTYTNRSRARVILKKTLAPN